MGGIQNRLNMKLNQLKALMATARVQEQFFLINGHCDSGTNVSKTQKGQFWI